MGKILSDRTAAKLVHLLNTHRQVSPTRRARGYARWVLVRCLSATEVGGNDVLDQCYPAIILNPACDFAAPPEEGFGCLLTVLGTDGNSVTPEEGKVYAAILTGEVESDRSGSGSSLVHGRPRAFAGEVGGGSATLDDYDDGGGNVTSDDTWTDVNVTTTTTSAGLFLIVAQVSVSAANTSAVRQLRARLVIDGSEVCASWTNNNLTSGVASLATLPLSWAAQIDSGKEVKIQLYRVGSGGWTSSSSFHTTGICSSFIHLIRLGD